MPNKQTRIILIGDVMGRHGRRLLQKLLPAIRSAFKPDVVLANGENSAGGLGIIRRTADEIFSAGVDVITGGNHIWDKKEALELLKIEKRILRPLNFPADAPGSGSFVYTTAAGVPVLALSLQGRVFMEPVVDNPFNCVDRFLKTLGQGMPLLVIVDFHAEATAEKQAMGFFLAGRVSAVLGTHTHVPTADCHILDGGTAFQTDVGMTGSLDSIIGMKKEPIITKFVTGINQRFDVEKENMILDMTVVDVDNVSGRALRIEAFRYHEETYGQQLP